MFIDSNVSRLWMCFVEDSTSGDVESLIGFVPIEWGLSSIEISVRFRKRMTQRCEPGEPLARSSLQKIQSFLGSHCDCFLPNGASHGDPAGACSTGNHDLSQEGLIFHGCREQDPGYDRGC